MFLSSVRLRECCLSIRRCRERQRVEARHQSAADGRRGGSSQRPAPVKAKTSTQAQEAVALRAASRDGPARP